MTDLDRLDVLAAAERLTVFSFPEQADIDLIVAAVRERDERHDIIEDALRSIPGQGCRFATAFRVPCHEVNPRTPDHWCKVCAALHHKDGAS